MILAGICNCLKDGAIPAVMRRSPAVRAAEICFQERIGGRGEQRRRLPALRPETCAEIPTGEYAYPPVVLLGDRLRTLVNRCGRGYAVWGGRPITLYASRSDGMYMRVTTAGGELDPVADAVRLSAEGCLVPCGKPYGIYRDRNSFRKGSRVPDGAHKKPYGRAAGSRSVCHGYPGAVPDG